MKDTKKLIIANWKMNPGSKKEAEVIFSKIVSSSLNNKKVEVIVCPPYPFFSIKDKIKNKKVYLGAQDIFFEKEGSYTGEVSGSMLSNSGVSYVIVGHSERRILGDTNEIVNKKLLASLKSKLNPIFCIGENKRDPNGFYLSFIKEQLHHGLHGVTKLQLKNIIIAYEPVWAIGKDAVREATPVEFMEIKIFIKKIIADMYDVKTASDIRIIYGGSVNPLNAESFLKEGEADGLLVGRDSLNPKKFETIINLATK